MLCLVGLALATCNRAEGAGRDGLLAELERAGLPRSIGPRLSITTAFRSCSLRAPDEGTIPRTECAGAAEGALPSERVLALASRASRAAPATADPDTLHAIALVDLLWADAGGNSLHRSISYLETAARLSERPAPILADLAAAYLVRAERAQSPRDLLEAVEVAEQALEADSTNAAARFNLALALDRLGLDGEAAREWERFLMVDAKSGWAGEARTRVRRLKTPPMLPTRPRQGASSAEVADFAARWPQEARLWGWDELLGEWGEAVLAGDTARAGEWLRLAWTVGVALERRGGDATLADAVREIRAREGDERATRALAEGHREYSAGRRAYENAEQAESAPFFARAAAAPPTRPLEAWATLFGSAARVYANPTNSPEAERVLHALALHTDAARYPALAARVHWTLGTIILRGGRYEQALGHYRTATSLYQRAGERESLGAIHYLVAETSFKLGDMGAGYGAMHRALLMLRPYGGSVWRHNLLYASAKAAEADGLRSAALRLQDQGIEVAARTGINKYVAEAHLVRAQRRVAAGRWAEAEEDIQLGKTLVQTLPAGRREWFEADLRAAEAGIALQRDPSRAVAALDAVVSFFAAGASRPRLVEALVKRADARLASGEVRGAAADLDRVVALVEEQRAGTASEPLRASLIEAARGAFDRMVMIQVRSRNAREALNYLERGRSAFGPAWVEGGGIVPAPLAAPPGQVVVDYAVMGDTLLVWTLSGSALNIVETRVERARLARIVERARSGLEMRDAGPATEAALGALYDVLIRPIEERIGADGTPIVVIADGDLADVPFAALLDRRRGRYLIESHPIRLLASLRSAMHAAPPRGAPAGKALLIADPAFDARAHPELGRLPGALAEVGALEAIYPGAVVISGNVADSTAVVSAFGGATVIHYAGHAVFDGDNPEGSFLALAPAHGVQGSSGRLTAAGIRRMNLGHVRLVVLSACETSRGRKGRAGGFLGFSGSLLAAGAGGVVGSLWRVDDETTGRLMVEFHRAYRTSGDGAEALRQAQLRLLRSNVPALWSPAAWGGLTYSGS
ncbi:MAG TPA: CHAT domain-containing protein [Longimicrobiaceae bacterium]|nr:CHAT domain-containing protein [Longimicrobiaceae bacterium]